MKIGAQFFTIRDFCKTLEDFDESLKKVADIGYRNVQISGTCAFEAQWLKERLDKYGLRCVITHTPADRLKGETEKVVEDHGVFGCDYIGLGWYGFHKGDPKEALEAFCAEYEPVAKSIKDGGKYFMYHNHDSEFIKLDGKPMLRHLSERFPADEMGFTLDTYWIQRGGGDPAYWIDEFSGRVPCIHLKDYAYDAKMSVVGEGNINFDRVFDAAEKAGTKFLLVEQDDCNGENPFDCLRRSFEYLKARGFE